MAEVENQAEDWKGSVGEFGSGNEGNKVYEVMKEVYPMMSLRSSVFIKAKTTCSLGLEMPYRRMIHQEGPAGVAVCS